MPDIRQHNLIAVVRDIVAAAGSTGEEPALVAQNLVDANLSGHDSHGVGMLPRYIACVHSGELAPNQHAEVLNDGGATLVVDGKAGYGQVVGREAMAIGIERAREHGVCTMTIRRSFHLCRIGAWAEQCADAGMVSMHHVNVTGHSGLVAPFRGSDARFTTNPYACALPATANNPHVVLDFATSAAAHGKVRVARNKGEAVPEGWLIDAKGKPTTDPNALFATPRGALLPFGEHKGYGLALVNELLAGVLSGGGTRRPENDRLHDTILNNMLSVIIDPGRFVDSAYYEQETDAMIEYVKASPPSNAAEPVLVPGDPERAMMAERAANAVPVDDETWHEIERAGESVGLSQVKLRATAGLI
ncbi:MAG: malate/lactate/ureidoglycolate dehydrogenase [Gammaproteobacteria bacterium]